MVEENTKKNEQENKTVVKTEKKGLKAVSLADIPKMQKIEIGNTTVTFNAGTEGIPSFTPDGQAIMNGRYPKNEYVPSVKSLGNVKIKVTKGFGSDNVELSYTVMKAIITQVENNPVTKMMVDIYATAEVVSQWRTGFETGTMDKDTILMLAERNGIPEDHVRALVFDEDVGFKTTAEDKFVVEA
ncbi:hypothetical protein [Methanococcus maripaludis]|uniref:Uncharacterized protein n=1 Tax=Methanococcus maripaludis OS7 TaxID=637915 RepID=A0A2Z5PRU1_METMI|nr:hypothetical protein [Methanococcus maripaludis]BAP62117.1 hypothetical protein MMOS7_00310 [Methanococcus maripaludis OS7]